MSNFVQRKLRSAGNFFLEFESRCVWSESYRLVAAVLNRMSVFLRPKFIWHARDGRLPVHQP